MKLLLLRWLIFEENAENRVEAHPVLIPTRMNAGTIPRIERNELLLRGRLMVKVHTKIALEGNRIRGKHNFA